MDIVDPVQYLGVLRTNKFVRMPKRQEILNGLLLK